VDIEWVNYFSSKRSDYLNAIIGVMISFVFGYAAILASDPTRSILALVGFFLLTTFLGLFYYQKFRFFDAWEEQARKSDTILDREEYNTKYKNLEHPKSTLASLI
jgi:hypothetical protein